MTDATVHKQEFLIKDLSTRSVTLYPARANIVRDINDICLKPGANEITIYGLTPTTDEHSVKVDGKGTATITDMTVDLVPNREIFEDVYPSETEDSDSDSDSDLEEDENDEVKNVVAELDSLKSALADAQENQNNAAKSLDILERYGTTLHSEFTKSSDLSPTLQACFTERQRIYGIWKDCKTGITELEKKIAAKAKEKTKLEKPHRKRTEKIAKEKQKVREKKERQKNEKRKEKRRLKEERLNFWPKKVYRVILHLDAPSISSRRDSLADNPKKSLPATSTDSTASDQVISLSLSYITYSASWSPRYDLLLTTPTSSGTIVYRASFKNTTSETWRDAKVVLSTSQTSYQGLGEEVPQMAPWHVSLAKGGGGSYYNNKSAGSLAPGANAAWGGGLYSIEEQTQTKAKKLGGAQPNINRNNLFGASGGGSAERSPNRGYGQLQQPQQQQVFQQQAQMPVRSQVQPGPQRHAAPPAGFGFSSVTLGGSDPTVEPSARRYRGRSALRMAEVATDGIPSAESGPPDWHDDGDAAATIAPDLESLDFQESSHEDYGMTTTYDVPGVRTLPPSDLTRRHKIAEVPLHGVQLSYILVPKLRAAAFLKARIRNSAPITLLRGQAGLTLDGTFLGNTWLPRCSAGETFSLPLGVDPAVHVSYAKPTVRRSTSGVFSKEDLVVYTRTCWITNTKPSSTVELRVLDQVPVSEDERLRITVLVPKGLKNEGDSVRAGVDAASSASAGAEGDEVSVRSSVVGSIRGKNVEGWGRAVANLKKGGEVAWDVKLNGGKGCKLVLEYEARIPGSESIVGIESGK